MESGEISDELPIIQYWHDSVAPAEIARLVATFQDHNPSLCHLLFNETTAEELITERFTGREVAAFRACAVPAMQADYFRYCAVFSLGGFYADVDFRCLRPLCGLIDTVDQGCLFNGTRGQVLNSFFLFAAPGHPLLRLALDVATVNIERRTAERVWWVTGPWIFSCLSALHSQGFDAARRRVAGTEMEQPLKQILSVIDEADLTAAFEGVRIAPYGMMAKWIAAAGSLLPHKQSDTHWVNWQAQGKTIFR